MKNNSSPRQEMLVRRCKGFESPGSGISFKVHDDQRRVIGALRAISLDMAEDLTVLEQMTRWRKTNADSFFTQFIPTVERTQRWLHDVLLCDSTRVMFLVEDEDGRRIGQFALCSITAEEAQLDNAIRGEAGGHPRLFYFVELAVLQFCFEYLGVQKVFGNLFSNNIMAILLHKTVGLSVEKVQLLRKTESQDEVRFDPVADPAQANTKVQQLTISVDCTSFYERHAELVGWPLLVTGLIEENSTFKRNDHE